MDLCRNPYAPGAGSPPPELAGRDAIIVNRAAIALDRIRNRRPTRSLVFYGLRGVGKTVLLNKIRADAEARGFATTAIEAPEGLSLPETLAPALRATLLRLSRGRTARAGVARALAVLRSFAKSLKIAIGDVAVGLEIEPEPGVADSGNLEMDLADLLSAIGRAAAGRETAVILAIDELQYVSEAELAALLRALHQTSQSQLPVHMLAAGLP